MKRFVTLSCLTFLFFSCFEKDVEDQTEYIKASINGTAWQADNITLIRNTSQVFKGAIGEYNHAKIILNIPGTTPNTYSLRENSVTIINFSADWAESDYSIKWLTLQESNITMFVVEASVTNDSWHPIDWRPVDTVLSKGTGDQAYETNASVSGWEYNVVAFRIRAVEGNNQSTYSNVRIMSRPTYTFYSAPGKEPRRGYNSTITVTGTDGPFLLGTFKFTIKSPTGEVTNVENGQFRIRYQ